MTKPTIEIPMITDLSEKKRKSVEHRLYCLSEQMKYCERYLNDYMAGKQNPFKTWGLIGYVRQATKEAMEELEKAHKFAQRARWAKIRAAKK